jgi:hypothetical protein
MDPQAKLLALADTMETDEPWPGCLQAARVLRGVVEMHAEHTHDWCWWPKRDHPRLECWLAALAEKMDGEGK